jgi:hypothetical protein
MERIWSDGVNSGGWSSQGVARSRDKGSRPTGAPVRTPPGLVHLTRHNTDLNLLVSGLPVAVMACHAKVRRGGYRQAGVDVCGEA